MKRSLIVVGIMWIALGWAMSDTAAQDPATLVGITMHAIGDRFLAPAGLIADVEYRFVYSSGSVSAFRRGWSSSAGTYAMVALANVLAPTCSGCKPSLQMVLEKTNGGGILATASQTLSKVVTDPGFSKPMPRDVDFQATNQYASTGITGSSVIANAELVTTLPAGSSPNPVRYVMGLAVATRRVISGVPIDSMSFSTSIGFGP